MQPKPVPSPENAEGGLLNLKKREMSNWKRTKLEEDGTYTIFEETSRSGFAGVPRKGFVKTGQTKLMNCIVGQKAVWATGREDEDGFSGPATRPTVKEYVADIQPLVCTLFKSAEHSVWCYQSETGTFYPAHEAIQ